LVLRPDYPNYTRTYLTGDDNRRVAGVLEEDFPEWLERQCLTDTDLFFVQKSDLGDRQVVQFVVLHKTIDLPKNTVQLPTPLHIPRGDDTY
jgi:hypothetical protein